MSLADDAGTMTFDNGGAPSEVVEAEEPASNCDIGYEGETISVYQSAGLTGPLAQILGPGFIDGSRDAVAAINEAGGIQTTF